MSSALYPGAKCADHKTSGWGKTVQFLQAFEKANVTWAFASTQHHHQGSVGYFSRVGTLEQRSFSTNPALKRLDPQVQTRPGWDRTPEELHWDWTGGALTGPEDLSGGKPLFHKMRHHKSTPYQLQLGDKRFHITHLLYISNSFRQNMMGNLPSLSPITWPRLIGPISAVRI